MFTREQRAKILERYENKEEKMLVSTILDKAFRFDKEDKLIFTNFLNLHELTIVYQILNELKINFEVYSVNEYANKKVIFFVPSYINDKEAIYKEYVSCIKITPNIKNKLAHKDYMGSIYSLGIKNEMIGDIFAYENYAYVFCMKSVLDFLLTNLYNVGNQEVMLEEIVLNDEEISKMTVKLIKKECIIPSLRIDAVLSEVYHISRSETKEKIGKGDLFLNDKNLFYPNTLVKENDIISLKRYGKMKVGSVIRKTKSDNVVIEIYQFA
ncbi:MAG: YlmH/Sll1252 family protein [Clostridia bacterium]|nr:YlmH/Sll1252 family protein [Clostridia bacterium]